jgi:hypothetical protein
MIPSLEEADKLPAGDTHGQYKLYMLGQNSSEEMSLPLASVHEGRA